MKEPHSLPDTSPRSTPACPPQAPSNESLRMRDVILKALQDGKGQDVVVLDVTGLTDICDFMIVVSGSSDRHIRTLAEKVLENMHAAGWRKLGMEGEDSKEWVLVDFVDVVLHIMRREARKRYDLESLWDATFGEPSESREETQSAIPHAGMPTG